MKTAETLLIYIFTACFLMGCNEIKSTLQVLNSTTPLRMADPRGKRIEIPEGEYEMTIDFAANKNKLSKLKIKMPSSKETLVVPLYLPARDDLLHTNTLLRLSANEIQQNFSLVITREVDLDEDHIGVSFYRSDYSDLLATTEFEHKPTRVAYDKESQEFLKSYQRVRRNQRAVVIPIDGDLDSFYYGPGAEALDAVVNFGAMVLIAPWVYFRYSNVQWILGNNTEDNDYVHKKWGKVISKNPVVDYIAFTHGGVDTDLAKPLQDLPRKKNQLRLAYTEGCSSGSAWSFIQDYNAAIAVGHYQTSASPLFSFSIVRNWVYGKSISEAVNRGWEVGKRRARLITAVAGGPIFEYGGWADVDDLIASSEPMSSWTPDLPPTKLFITKSAVPERRSLADQEIYEIKASHILEPNDLRWVTTLNEQATANSVHLASN